MSQIKKSNLYKKSLEIKFGDDEKLFTIRDLTLNIELDFDLHFKMFNNYLKHYEIEFNKTKKKDEYFNAFIHIEDIIHNNFTKDELKELAIFGKTNIVEFEEDEVSYYQIVLNLYSILLNFQIFRFQLKKK